MELGGLVGVIRARKWLIIGCVLMVTLGSLIVSSLQTSMYRGAARVMVSRGNRGTTLLGSAQPQASSEERDFQTQVQVMQSRTIAEQVIKQLNLDTTASQLLKHITVTTDSGANIATIEATADSAQRAASIANAFALAWVAWSRDTDRSSIKSAADDVQARLAVAQQRIVVLEALVALRRASRTDRLELQAQRSAYATLASKLEELLINEQLETGSGSVLATAAPDTRRVSPNPPRDVALGLVVGLMLGVGLAFLAEALDNTIKSVEDAEEAFGAPVLAKIPAEKLKGDETSRVALLEQPGGAVAEAFRVLRNNLGYMNIGHDIKVVLVTSPAPSEGKSTVAANLAVALSQAGQNVALMVCDFHRPGAARFFDFDDRIGLSDVLIGTCPIERALRQPAGLERLAVLPAGKLPPNPSDLLGSEAMGRLMTVLRGSADWIILDCTPILAVSDAAALVRWVDGVLVVAHAEASTRPNAREGRRQLDSVGARVLGVALWGLKDSHLESGYRGYSAYADQSVK